MKSECKSSPPDDNKFFDRNDFFLQYVEVQNSSGIVYPFDEGGLMNSYLMRNQEKRYYCFTLFFKIQPYPNVSI